jgi:hypothetical protein
MEIQSLLDSLNKSQPSRWRDAALSVLGGSSTSFEGDYDLGATASAEILLQTYRLRLEHIRKHHIEAIGIEELLDALAAQNPASRVKGGSLFGADSSLYAFWNEENVLIGCITVRGRNTGERSLKMAMGDPI